MSHDQNDHDQARFEPSAAEPITPAGEGTPRRRRPFLMPRLLLGIAAVGLLAVGRRNVACILQQTREPLGVVVVHLTAVRDDLVRAVRRTCGFDSLRPIG